MSGFTADFNKRLNDLIDQTVKDFFQKIHERYDIPLKELNEIRIGASSQDPGSSVTKEGITFTASELMGNRPQLLRPCVNQMVRKIIVN